ncbi:hypothetical protein V6N11_081937 [Hibiscus sabdariffa]|uniref:Uncharacterized protein n=1 Tax=Hibiscus sabdariffa TaxID=183260 RepID=A0ABR2Q7M6_9ROSI
MKAYPFCYGGHRRSKAPLTKCNTGKEERELELHSRGLGSLESLSEVERREEGRCGGASLVAITTGELAGVRGDTVGLGSSMVPLRMGSGYGPMVLESLLFVTLVFASLV